MAGTIKDVKDYRSYYKEYFNIDFGKEFDVHHIDCNRDNNDIKNLLLLPKKLHVTYHTLKNEIALLEVPKKITGNKVSNSNIAIASFLEFFNVLDECNKWFDYKSYMLGEIPNIHNIKI